MKDEAITISDSFGYAGTQHFLKSAELRDITYADICEMNENEAFEFFVAQRWGSKSHVVCPECGAEGKHYFISRGKRWRCRFLECGKYFSVFTGTAFQDRKLSYKKLLMFIAVFVVFANGLSFDTLSGLLDIQVKTAQVLIGKVREILWRSRLREKLSGVIHMDGGYFGGRPRHARVRRIDVDTIRDHVHSMLTKKAKQPVKTAKANMARRIKNRRVVFVIRQLSTIPGEGAIKTIVAAADSENENFALSLAMRYIEPGSTVMTDENPAYNQLSKYYDHLTVEHAKEFATVDGINSNQAESYFSRLRRHVLGVSHRIEPKYVEDIANEMAWREDVRRMTYKQRLQDILNCLYRAGRSRFWTGYWQGCNRPGELIWSPESKTSKIRKLR